MTVCVRRMRSCFCCSFFQFFSFFLSQKPLVDRLYAAAHIKEKRDGECHLIDGWDGDVETRLESKTTSTWQYTTTRGISIPHPFANSRIHSRLRTTERCWKRKRRTTMRLSYCHHRRRQSSTMSNKRLLPSKIVSMCFVRQYPLCQ